jgi:uncharacterized membrane protein
MKIFERKLHSGHAWWQHRGEPGQHPGHGRSIGLSMPIATRPAVRRRLLGRAHVVFLLLLAAMLGQMAWYYPRLPERMASHFNVAGQADAFMPKQEFMKMNLMVIGLLASVFLAVPMLVVRMPKGMINLPNKDYWLAPERRSHTDRTIQGFVVGFGNLMMLFLLVVFRDAMQASLLPTPQLSNRVWVMLLGLGGFMIYWTMRFMRAFRLPR